MEFKRKFGRKKEPNSKKGLLLVLILAIIIFLWFNAESLLESLF